MMNGCKRCGDISLYCICAFIDPETFVGDSLEALQVWYREARQKEKDGTGFDFKKFWENK